MIDDGDKVVIRKGYFYWVVDDDGSGWFAFRKSDATLFDRKRAVSLLPELISRFPAERLESPPIFTPHIEAVGEQRRSVS